MVVMGYASCNHREVSEARGGEAAGRRLRLGTWGRCSGLATSEGTEQGCKCNESEQRAEIHGSETVHNDEHGCDKNAGTDAFWANSQGGAVDIILNE